MPQAPWGCGAYAGRLARGRRVGPDLSRRRASLRRAPQTGARIAAAPANGQPSCGSTPLRWPRTHQPSWFLVAIKSPDRMTHARPCRVDPRQTSVPCWGDGSLACGNWPGRVLRKRAMEMERSHSADALPAVIRATITGRAVNSNPSFLFCAWPDAQLSKRQNDRQIGRASCRERVFRAV